MSWKRSLRIIGFFALLVLLVAYLAYAVVNFREGNPQEVCADVAITVRGGSGFMEEEDIVQLLTQADLYPIGWAMNAIRTKDIEQVLLRHGMVRRAICYKAGNPTDVNEGSLCIDVTLRRPVLHVLPDQGTSYYVDDEGVCIPSVPRRQKLPTATGAIDTEFATGLLADFALSIAEDPFWSDMVAQVHVERDRRQRTVVRLVPRRGDQTILLGPLDGYDKKLRRMRVFYEKAIPQVGWTRYKQFNLEFDNQVVCERGR